MEVIKGVLEDLSVLKQSHKGTYNYSLVQTIIWALRLFKSLL